jgi:hypothetical protein
MTLRNFHRSFVISKRSSKQRLIIEILKVGCFFFLMYSGSHLMNNNQEA